MKHSKRRFSAPGAIALAGGRAMSSGRTLEQTIAEIRMDGHQAINVSFMSLPPDIHQVRRETGGDEIPTAHASANP